MAPWVEIRQFHGSLRRHCQLRRGDDFTKRSQQASYCQQKWYRARCCSIPCGRVAAICLSTILDRRPRRFVGVTEREQVISLPQFGRLHHRYSAATRVNRPWWVTEEGISNGHSSRTIMP